MIHYRLNYKTLKRHIKDLTQDAYQKHYNDLKAVRDPVDDPKIVFNDATSTIEISHYGEDLVLFNRNLANAMSRLCLFEGSTAQALDKLCLSDEGEDNKKSFLDHSRDALRGLPYQDVPDTTCKLDQEKSAAQNLLAVANSGPGVSFGGGHGDAARNQVMMDLLKPPQELGKLRLFFIEELGVGDQPLIDRYLSSNAGTEPPRALGQRIASIKGMGELLAQMRDYNLAHPDAPLHVYGINSSEAKMRPGKMGPETRVAMMNAVAKRAMDAAIAQHPGQKFLAFVGDAHSNTHAGGIPGISQMYGVPAVKMDTTGTGQLTLAIEDKALRGMPSKGALARIEEALDEGKSQGTEEHVKALAELVQADRKQTFGQKDRAQKKAYAQEMRNLNVPLTDREVAEIVVIQSEDTALRKGGEPADTADVNAKKHGKLIEKLIKRLGQLTEKDKRDSQALIDGLVEAVSKDDVEAFYLKPKRNPVNHVSIQTDVAKKEWLAKLDTLGQQA